MFKISLSQEQGRIPVTIMTLKGDLDAYGADLFDAQTRDVIAGGAKDVLLELSEVPFMSSAGIRCIHNLFYQLHPKESEEYQRILNEGVRQGIYKAPHLKLLNPSSDVRRALEMTGLGLYMAILNGDQTEAVYTF